MTTPKEAPAPAVPPRGAAPGLSDAWPRSAQLATAFLLGVALTLAGVHLLGASRWTSRPTELRETDGFAYRIDLNRAERPELLQIPGVGEKLAGRIEEYRREHGGFRQTTDLTAVRGVGPATLERVGPWVRTDGDENGSRPAGAPKASAPASRGRPTKESKLAGLIDVNTASPAELQGLPGIGPKMAQRIVDERARAPFRTVEELRRVSGIGPKTLEKLRPHVRIGSTAAGTAQARAEPDADER